MLWHWDIEIRCKYLYSNLECKVSTKNTLFCYNVLKMPTFFLYTCWWNEIKIQIQNLILLFSCLSFDAIFSDFKTKRQRWDKLYWIEFFILFADNCIMQLKTFHFKLRSILNANKWWLSWAAGMKCRAGFKNSRTISLIANHFDCLSLVPRPSQSSGLLWDKCHYCIRLIFATKTIEASKDRMNISVALRILKTSFRFTFT